MQEEALAFFFKLRFDSNTRFLMCQTVIQMKTKVAAHCGWSVHKRWETLLLVGNLSWGLFGLKETIFNLSQ